MRVLHVIDPSADAGPCSLRLLADVMRRLDAQQNALIVGTRRDVDLAVQCGVDVTGSICPPQNLPWTGANALRQAVRAIEKSRGRHDVIHAWSVRSGALAVLGLGNRPGVTTLHVAPAENLASWHSLRTLNASSHRVFAASTSIRRQLRQRGLANDRVALLPAGVDARNVENDRQSLRDFVAERSEVAIDHNTFLVGLLGEPVDSADANVAATIAARVALSGRPIKLLVHPDAAHRFLAEAMMRQLGFSPVILVEELIAQPWRLAPALDAVLFVESRVARSSASSVLPLLWALASGTPVVAEEMDSFRDILADGTDGMLVKPGEVNIAAERLTKLHDDRDWRQRLSEQGRAIASEMFEIDSYAIRLRHAYDLLLANRTVRISADQAMMADISTEAIVA